MIIIFPVGSSRVAGRVGGPLLTPRLAWLAGLRRTRGPIDGKGSTAILWDVYAYVEIFPLACLSTAFSASGLLLSEHAHAKPEIL